MSLQTTLFKKMSLIRQFEQLLATEYPAQKIKTPVHLSIGQEAIAAAVCTALTDDDYIWSTHRGHGHYLAKNGDVYRLLAELYGQLDGCSGGYGGSMHVFDLEKGVMGTSGIVGGTISIALGSATAAMIRQNGRVSVCFFGDGSTEQGVFAESLNLAALYKLPVIFVCENNGYATHATQHERQAQTVISEKAKAYGVYAETIDGNDVEHIYEKAVAAVERARCGEGPTLLECKTFRWKTHVGPIEDDYAAEQLQTWKQKCPITTLKQKQTVTCQHEWTQIEQHISDELHEHLQKIKQQLQ